VSFTSNTTKKIALIVLPVLYFFNIIVQASELHIEYYKENYIDGFFTDDLNGNKCCRNTLLQLTHSLAWVFICLVNLDDDGWQGCLQGIF
jgi:hypothetical protein